MAHSEVWFLQAGVLVAALREFKTCHLCKILMNIPKFRPILSFFHLPWFQALQVTFRYINNFNSKYLGLSPLSNVPEIPGPIHLTLKHWALSDLVSAERAPRESNRVWGEVFQFNEASFGHSESSCNWRI